MGWGELTVVLVGEEQWRESALVVLGHGSSVNAQSAAAVYQQAAAVRQRGLFGEVREAFWKQDPQISDVLASLNQPQVFIVPLFISEGYFSEQVIPRELGFDFYEAGGNRSKISERGSCVHYCRAVGTHRLMPDVILAAAQEVVRQFPFPRAPAEAETTLLLAGHGTVQDENSRVGVETQAAAVAARGRYAAVQAMFLEEEPRISRWHELVKTPNVVVVPFFVSEGMHTQEDIPVLLGEPERIVKTRIAGGQAPWRNPTEKKGKLVWYASSVGNHPKVSEVILERVREAGSGQAPKLGQG